MAVSSLAVVGDRHRPVREVQWFPRIGVPWLYLASLGGTPVALVLAATEPLPAPDALYAAPIFFAALPIFLMTVTAAGATGHRTYSWWGLRAQVWLHLGGAVPAALRHLGEEPAPGRHQRWPSKPGSTAVP